MFYILIQACLVNAGHLCIIEEKPVNSVSTLSGNTCMVAAPMVVSVFNETHPEWEIKKWECTNGR